MLRLHNPVVDKIHWCLHNCSPFSHAHTSKQELRLAIHPVCQTSHHDSKFEAFTTFSLSCPSLRLVYRAEMWPRSFSKIQESIIGYPMATKLPKLFSRRGLFPRAGVLLAPSSTANSSGGGISEWREITSVFISMGVTRL
jgi:hypothetical protein